MKIDLKQFRQTYLQESADHVSSMEADLLALRGAPTDTELLNSIFRSAHSIKGGAGSFGMTSLVRFTHSLENVLDRLRSLEMQATDSLIDVLLRSVDVLSYMLSADDETDMPEEALEIMAHIQTLMATEPDTANETPPAPEKIADETRPVHLYRVDFAPAPDLFASGTNPIVLLRNLAALGTVSCCHLHSDKLPSLADLDPARCYLSWMMELASVCPEAELREVFEFVEHLADIQVQCIDVPPGIAAAEPAAEPVAQHIAEPIAEHVAEPVAAPAHISEKPASTPEHNAAPASDPRKQAAKKSEASGDTGTIRVAIEKVDRLIDLVGELVIAHVMTAQMVESFEPSCLPKLRDAVAAMERNTRELHERVMSVRMLPVGMLFQRYPRAVYDIAQSTGKHIRLETSGEETEIDRSMLESLGDPLTHLIRNSADHGIESPAERLAAGKPEEGVVSLRAYHRSGRIVIEISDDGAGIDTERVRRKGIERGLIGPDAPLNDDQVRMLIFEPGFSTCDKISNLSGRGVGMDVVKRNVQQLNGTVSLASQKGRGTTVSIELPLTLAILEGLLVRVIDRTLVLPLLSVIETVPLRKEQIVRLAEQGEVIVIREESIPLLRLARYLGLSEQSNGADTDARNLAVIVEAGNRKIGLVVDELLGQQQVVVKSLERHLRKVDGLMGATILGDGCVAPIVDVAGMAALNLFSLRNPAHPSARGSEITAPGQLPLQS